MVRQYDSKAMPLRRRPSMENVNGGPSMENANGGPSMENANGGMPLRRRLSTENLNGGTTLINNGIRRFSPLAILMAISVIGASLHVRLGMITSMPQSKIRKSPDFYVRLPYNSEGSPTQSIVTRNIHDSSPKGFDKSGENSIAMTSNNGRAENLRGDSTSEEESEDRTALSANSDNRSSEEKREYRAINHAPEEKSEDSGDNHVQVATNNKKLRLFLHVGPQKTGSSTLQSMLDKLSSLTEELNDDNIYFRHIMPETGDFDCDLNKWGGYHNCKASERLKALIQKAHNDGKNLLLTDENLGEDFVAGLRDVIDDKDWDVTVVVMYRRIHEWLISWYNQINKTTNQDSEGNVLFNEKGIPCRTEHTKWPDQGGVRVPSFASWYEEYTRYWEPSDFTNKHRSIEYYNLYKKVFGNVILYNMHQGGSMVSDFMCNIVGATHACNRLKTHEMEVKKINGSVNLNHDILSVFAYDQGHVVKTLGRKEVGDAVTTFIQESGKSIPRICDLKMKQQIRNWLLDTEKIMVGEDDWTDAKKTDLLQLYSSFAEKGKMCDIDKEAILQDEEWLNFFHSLGKAEKRNIVLHVGPIGGKAIHETLRKLSANERELEQNNYTLVDLDENNHFDCTQDACTATPGLGSMFSSLEDAGKNVIISNDNLDDRFVQALKESIDEQKWNVKVVVGYIRLNQLLLAMYEISYNHDNVDPNWRSLIGENDDYDAEKFSKWLDQGGAAIPGFNSWFHSVSDDSIMQKLEYLGVDLRGTYASSFDDVDFFAYRPGETLAKDFICQVVPGSTQACKALSALKTKELEERALLPNYIEADILAVRAHEKGLVKKEISRETLRNTILWKLQSTRKPLARICDSGVTKHLYDLMIDIEKKITGDNFNSKRIAWVNQDIQDFLKVGKLCNIDIEKELQDLTWVNMFRYNPDLQ